MSVLLRRYWLHIAAAALLAFCAWRAYAWAYDQGHADASHEWLVKENAELGRLARERDEAITARIAAQKKADELAKLPPKVVERVRSNPSGCSLSKPVADSLRDQVRATNDAIRAVP